MEIEPEHFQNDHYAYARREWSDSMFNDFMEKYMPAKEKTGPYSGYSRLANF